MAYGVGFRYYMLLDVHLSVVLKHSSGACGCPCGDQSLGREPVGRSVKVEAAFARHHIRYASWEFSEFHAPQAIRIDDIDSSVVFPDGWRILPSAQQSVAFAYVQAAFGIGFKQVVIWVCR